MRVFKSMRRCLPAGIFALVLLIAGVLPAAAITDTGTYQIANYVVTMEPQSSGQVKMTYQQEWKVLSGHIPWIMVGLTHSNYSVVSYGEAVNSVSSENSGGFTGVRIDLNKDYQAGESFKIEFVILQSNFLERLTEEKKWRINFTPGWFDNAITDHLQINLVSPVDTQTYSLIQPQALINNNTLTWERDNIPGGGRFNIVVECLDGGFLSSTVPVKGQGPNTWVVVGIIAAVLVGIYLLATVLIRANRKARDAEMAARIAATEKELAQDREKAQKAEKGFKEYVEEKGIQVDEQGRYYDRGYGGYITPIIWMAILSNQSRTAQTPTGTSSCACACVSCACACACACAGGGAAGCARKTLHECSECESKERG
jgi:hypothetical protein